MLDSREADEGATIRRRRSCPECTRRFTTLETAALVVMKRSGIREAFSTSKVLSGVRKACQGRPVDDDDLAVLGHVVEETVRGQGAAEVASQDIGLAVLAPLRRLDEVAYLRFASVYRSFDSLTDFEDEIIRLRATSDGGDDAVTKPSSAAPIAAPPLPMLAQRLVRGSTG